MATLRSLVLPWGRTSGRRIVLDGDGGTIRLYDDQGVLIAELSPTVEGGGLWTRGVQARPLSAFLGGGKVQFDTVDPDTTDIPAIVLLDTDGTSYVSLIQSSGARVAGHTEGRVILQSTGTGRGRVFVTPDGTSTPPGYPAKGCDLEVFGAIDAHDLIRGDNGLEVSGASVLGGHTQVVGPLDVQGTTTLTGDAQVFGGITTTTGVQVGGKLTASNIRFGSASTPAPGAGGGQTEVNVTFSPPMVGTPRVVCFPVSAATDLSASMILGATTNNSTSGFTIRCHRSTNSATQWSWIAIS